MTRAGRKMRILRTTADHFPLPLASTTLARSATSKTSRSRRSSRATSWGCASSTRSTTSPRRSAATRRSWTAARRTRDSTSSAASSGPASRWRTTLPSPSRRTRNCSARAAGEEGEVEASCGLRGRAVAGSILGTRRDGWVTVLQESHAARDGEVDGRRQRVQA
jgi:hypothetical protein